MPHRTKRTQLNLRARMARVLFAPFFLCGTMIGLTQQPVQNQSTKQPSLTVDRDPVPSPDPDVPAKSQTGAPQGVGLGTIERQGGKYTLHEDAYEVRLNATVLDSGGR